ncbi:nucleoside transporter C-terminal domain-containing protein [Thalassobaculum sp.]|uniref:NupC/NupG family nucleoside CNT transporter n=1 Tax=Thalassobaculum sp. TaxID=2022740 RepID=UPI0032EF6687
MERLQSGFGLIVIFAIAWAISENRQTVRPRTVLAGIGLQLAVAVVVLHVTAVRDAFAALNGGVLALQAATQAGSSLVFGYLGGGPLPFEETRPGASFILAFRALPLVIVVSALTALLTYWRILPWIVKGFAYVFERALGIGGAVGLATAANIFVGMVEAPLLVRPYIARMTRGELFMMMTCGMATIAGTMLVLYATILGPVLPDAVGHLLIASIVSAPAALAIAALMVPAEGPPTSGTIDVVSDASGPMDAVTRGTQAGLQLFLGIVAMLLVMVALVSLVDAVLDLLPMVAGEPLSLGRVFGWVMRPMVWLIGVPWDEAAVGGRLMGTKTALNELVAYLDMAKLPADALSERSRLIMVYALCGFANFGSLGIMIGGLAALVPERRGEIAALGMKSIIGGTLATLATGATIGLL